MYPAIATTMARGSPVTERKSRLHDEDVDAVAARLTELRLAYGYDSQAAWARFLGLKRSAVAHYEEPRRMITLPAAMRYVICTGISLDWIYRGIEAALPVEVKGRLDAYRASRKDSNSQPLRRP